MENNMNSLMETSFCNYFRRLQLLYNQEFSTKPTVSYSKELNSKLLIGNPDEDGEIQWLPIKQDQYLNWLLVEQRLRFTLRKEIKEYYNTYFFLVLSGSYKGCKINFYSLDGSKPIEQIIINAFEDAQYVFPQKSLLLIGNAVIDDNDSYFLFFDNDTGNLFCYESETNTKIVLSNSIAEVIGNMEACI